MLNKIKQKLAVFIFCLISIFYIPNVFACDCPDPSLITSEYSNESVILSLKWNFLNLQGVIMVLCILASLIFSVILINKLIHKDFSSLKIWQKMLLIPILVLFIPFLDNIKEVLSDLKVSSAAYDYVKCECAPIKPTGIFWVLNYFITSIPYLVIIPIITYALFAIKRKIFEKQKNQTGI